MTDKGIARSTWNMAVGSSLLGDPDGAEMFPHMRNSNHVPRKRQSINKVHKNGDVQLKVV
jgi:hypothetical protein